MDQSVLVDTRKGIKTRQERTDGCHHPMPGSASRLEVRLREPRSQ